MEMEQNIVCKKGMCIDMNDPDFLDCEEKYDNIIDIIECQLEKEMKKG
ncbi:MAG: hypothetical protein QGI38_02470 [Candidatus Woesearchaeota archaeon]|nr:hypothetical protein [Candidatus Woesearchaeota archaeon]